MVNSKMHRARAALTMMARTITYPNSNDSKTIVATNILDLTDNNRRPKYRLLSGVRTATTLWGTGKITTTEPDERRRRKPHAHTGEGDSAGEWNEDIPSPAKRCKQPEGRYTDQIL
ncbi:hypothetical protein FIE12Z_624 [Fusarium flagelliforme]|uniref:Uncharacterized protein n=1 Tax=Fusarium flagelliforme TaxID=2675880 RepID=A0A395N4R6_9HYPO|nr:hypothetical protein FIE12Z_624 [Fusarium flagelliforme]